MTDADLADLRNARVADLVHAQEALTGLVDDLLKEVEWLRETLSIRELQRDQALARLDSLAHDIALHKDADRIEAEEREACAQLAESHAEHVDGAAFIATAIRARK